MSNKQNETIQELIKDGHFSTEKRIDIRRIRTNMRRRHPSGYIADYVNGD